jgi:acetolactate synthase-1/2/3 large subunit
MARMTGGQAVVESLIAQGVDTVFGIVSVHNLHIFDALKDAVKDGRLRFVGARHEHAAGCMADGYARATGRPGVYITSSGPGAADSIGAMGESYHSSVPVLQVTTEIETEWLGQGLGATHEARDQLAMFGAVADFRAMPLSVEDVPNQIASAFEHMRTHHPRPSVVAVPTDLLGQSADAEVVPRRLPALQHAAPAVIADAVRLLSQAERPVIWAGSGVMASEATPELIELAERLGAPVALADGGKGAFPEDHPLCLGSALHERFWGQNPVSEYLATCDAMLIVGSSVPLRSTKGVGLAFPRNIVQVDIDRAMFGRNYPTAVGLEGDAKAVLGQLLAAMESTKRTDAGNAAEIADLRARVQQSVATQFGNEARLFSAIRNVIGRDAVVVADPNIPAYAAQRVLPVYEPRTFFHPHGWVGIGYAFPASLGAKVGMPQRRVVCVTGDGGFQYNLQELGTAVQHGIAPVVLLFNDNAWGALQSYQQRQFDERYFGVKLDNPDFQALAAAYGIEADRVARLDQFVDALEAAVRSDAARIIEVEIPDGVANFV